MTSASSLATASGRSEAQSRALETLAIALEQIELGICCFDSEHRLIMSNYRYAELYGLGADRIRPGMKLQRLAPSRLAAGSPSSIAHDKYVSWCRDAKDHLMPSTWNIELQDGRTLRICHYPMGDGGWVTIHEDATDRLKVEAQLRAANTSLREAYAKQAEYEKEIARLSYFDVLTEIPNRLAAAKRLASAIAHAESHGESFAVLSVDVDHFRGINEFFGHSVGDAALRAVVKKLRAAAGFVARTGGDEFMLLSHRGVQPAEAASVADRIQAAFVDDLYIEGHRLRIRVSTGIAVYPEDGADAATLIGSSYAALESAKKDRRGSFRFFRADLDQRHHERIALQQELRSVLRDGELVLFYQPQARISGEIVGFEALVRWHHPKRGILLPGKFIAIAEESGLISDIGEWVLREACREAASWKRPLKIAINVSPLQFADPNLPDIVRSALADTGLAPERLELEITENLVINDPTRVASVLRELKTLGVRIAMDDFGIGYSSLSSLQSFPIDKIKIDRTFIANLGTNETSTAIVRAIIALGRSLKVPVVAEGVETEGQRATLIKEGCRKIQGYLVGRPLPIDQYAGVTNMLGGAARPGAGTTVSSSKIPTILLVEDEPSVQDVIREILEEAGFAVVTAQTGEEALALLKRDQSLAALLTDIRLPGSDDGWAIAEKARQWRPGLPVVYASAYHREQRQVEGSVFLAKPYRAAALLNALGEVGVTRH